MVSYATALDTPNFMQTFPPRTSSPMMMHPAVWIMRLLLSSADDVMMLPKEVRNAAAELWV